MVYISHLCTVAKDKSAAKHNRWQKHPEGKIDVHGGHHIVRGL